MTFQKIAVVGAGLIGTSWAAFFLAKGFDVIATDPAPGAETRMRAQVDSIWPDMEAMGAESGAHPGRLYFYEDLATALKGVDFVQESGPEHLAMKRELFARMDAVLPAHVIIASSSSALKMSDIQGACARHPERCMIAHPFNPPHIIPLVEIVGGQQTSPELLDICQSFFEGLGKKCIRLKKEVYGHAANRLAWALYREAVWLVEQGYASVADVDRAIAWGPGLRWAGMGPHLLYHLGGGDGGMEQFFHQFGDTLRTLWAEQASPDLTPELAARLAGDIRQMAGGASLSALSSDRDRFLIELLAHKARSPESIAQ